jgi:hypothetical protein
MHRMTIAAAACAVAALSAATAFAARPVEPVQVVRVNETVTIPAGQLCSFPVIARTTGHVRVKVEAERVFENPSLTTVFTGPGGSVTTKDRGLDRATFRPDGTVLLLSTGIHFQARLADGTKVEQGIGARVIVFDAATGDLISVTFKNPNDSFGSGPCVFIG